MKAKARKEVLPEEPIQFKRWCLENNGIWYYDKHMDSYKCVLPSTGRIYISENTPQLTDEEFQELARKMWKVIFPDVEGEE